MSKLQLKQEELGRIRKLANVKKENTYQFLGYLLDLETAELRDQLASDGTLEKVDECVLNVILSHYSTANRVAKAGKLIKFKDLPGGPAYELAFQQRAVQPVAETFGEKPAALVEAAKVLGGTSLNHGDASVEIPALEGIPITYIMWKADEFSAQANVLYDESACALLPTEDLAVLGELTSSRLKKAEQQF